MEQVTVILDSPEIVILKKTLSTELRERQGILSKFGVSIPLRGVQIVQGYYEEEEHIIHPGECIIIKKAITKYPISF